MFRSHAALLLLTLSLTVVGCASASVSPPTAETSSTLAGGDMLLVGSHRWTGKAFDGEKVTDVTIITENAAVVSAVFHIDLFCGSHKESPAMSFTGVPARITRSAAEGRLTDPPSFSFEGSADTACGVRSLTVTGYLSSPTTLNGFAGIKPPANPDRPFVAHIVRWNADRQ